MSYFQSSHFQENDGEYKGDESYEDFSDGSDIELRDLEEDGKDVMSNVKEVKKKNTTDVPLPLKKASKEVALFGEHSFCKPYKRY